MLSDMQKTHTERENKGTRRVSNMYIQVRRKKIWKVRKQKTERERQREDIAMDENVNKQSVKEDRQTEREREYRYQTSNVYIGK